MATKEYGVGAMSDTASTADSGGTAGARETVAASAAAPTTRRADPRRRLRSDMVGRTRRGHKTIAGLRGDRGGEMRPTVTP